MRSSIIQCFSEVGEAVINLRVCVDVRKDFFRKRSDRQCDKDPRDFVQFHVWLGEKSRSGNSL